MADTAPSVFPRSGGLGGRGPVLFSVVVPTYNRAETLLGALKSWSEQVPGDLPFEVIVVDDGSTDDTRSVLGSYQPARYELRIRSQPNQGPAVARNSALGIAAGDYVLFTGDDIEPAANLLHRHHVEHQRLADYRVAVLGRIDWAPYLPLTSTMRHVDGVGAQQFSFNHMKDGEEYDYRHFYTSNVSVSRDLLELESSGFSTDFPLAAFEDAEYAYRLRNHGLRITYHESARAWHHHSYVVESFFHRQVACGQMAAVLIGKWPKTRTIVGGDAVVRRIRRLWFMLPSKQRRLAIIANDLDVWEARAINLASAFDRSPTPVVDPLLKGLFQYAYLKGLSSATVRPAIAGRLFASWFLEHVGDGVCRLVNRLHTSDLSSESESLYPLIEPFRDISILGENGNRSLVKGM